jgi:hypothetical protein
MAWNVDGVVEARFLALEYNEPSETLVAHFLRDGEAPTRAIYTRRRTATEYTLAFGPDAWTSATSVVCAAKAPLVLFNVYVRDHGPGRGSNWSHVGRINLATGEVSVVLDKASFRAKHGRAWISEVYSASDDGETILCSITNERPDPTDESPGRIRIEYFLCRLVLSTGDFERITLLRNTCF